MRTSVLGAALAERIKPSPHPYATNPVGWASDVLGAHLWSKQREILEALRDNRRVAVHSAMGVGKSFVAAVAALWWIYTRTAGKARVITTAPSQAGMEDAVWFDLPRLHSEAGLPGYVTRGKQPTLVLPIGDTQLPVAVGRKPADPVAGVDASVAASNLRGRHATEGVLFIIDEAAGIQEWVWDMAGDIATEDAARILVIGNPDYEGSRFWRECQQGSTFEVIHLDTFDSPNFTGEEVPSELAASLPTQTRVDEVVAQFGEDSPAYEIKIRGLFPADASEGVVPLSWVQRCRGPEVHERAGIVLPVELGVDVGGSSGGDWTVVAGRRGLHAMPIPREWKLRVDARDSARIADVVIDAIATTQADTVKIDAPGVGYGPIGDLQRRLDTRADRRIEWPVAVIPVNVGVASLQTDQVGRPRFRYLKDELWWNVARALSEPLPNGYVRRPGQPLPPAWDLSELDDSTIMQLTDVRWRLDAAQRIVIEEKAEVKRRTGRSPDEADALILAFANIPAPTKGVHRKPTTYRDGRGRR